MPSSTHFRLVFIVILYNNKNGPAMGCWVPSALHNPLEERFGYQLRRASLVMMAELAGRIADLGLTITEASILVLVRANPGANQTELSHTLAIKRANMVPLIAGLEDRGLVQRRPADGRSHALQVSKAGAALATKADLAMRAHEAQFLGPLSRTNQRQILRQLTAIRAQGEKV
jgi:DNA-binding MarR family transcriptional regulator